MIIKNSDELEQAIENFTASVKEAIEATTRTTTYHRWKDRLPGELTDLIREKRSARRFAQRTWDPRDGSRYNRLVFEVKMR